MSAVRIYDPEADAPESSQEITVKDVIELYLRHSSAQGMHCHAARTDRVRTFALFSAAVGHLYVSDAKPFHLTDFIDSHTTWKSTSTRRAKANEIRAAFAWALDGERILKNPFARVRYAEAVRRPDLPDATLETICNLANKRFERSARFLRLTGVRLSELCRATWREIDFERSLWTIRKHKSLRYTKKPKTVALVPEAVELLRSLLGAAIEEAKRIGTVVVLVEDTGTAAERDAGFPKWEVVPYRVEVVAVADKTRPPTPEVVEVLSERMPAEAFVFLNNRNHPWNRILLGQQLRRLKKRHGINCKASLHGIRHRAASAAIAAGGAIKLVSKQLGHSSVAVTERFYCDLDDAVDEIRDAFGKGIPK